MEYYKYRRAFCCFVIGALGFVQISLAGVKPDFNDPAVQAAIALQYNQTAGKLQWMLAGGSSLGYDARYPVAAITKPLGGVNSVGNWELYLDTAGKPSTRTKADFQFPPFKSEVSDVSAKFKMRDIAGAIGRFANKVFTPLAIGSAVYDLAKELNFYLSRNPDGTLKVEQDANPDYDGFEYAASTEPWRSSRQGACDDFKEAMRKSSNWVVTSSIHNAGTTQCTVIATQYGGSPFTSIQNLGKRNSSCPAGQYLIQSICKPFARVETTQIKLEDAIANKSVWIPASNILRTLEDTLKSGEQIKPDTTTLTTIGPANSPSPSPTVTNTTASTVTTTTSNAYNYSNDTITNTVTNTTNNYDKINNTTATTTTTNVIQPEPPKDSCVDYPERVGCLNIDTPTVELPKKDKNVTYAAETLFGGGSCPAPKTATYFGKTLTFSYQPTCDVLTNYIRFMMIAAALYTAYLMILKSLKG